MQLANIKVLVISISNPIQIGIYENDILIKTIVKEGKTSDVLPLIFEKILLKYNINDILYVNGPGSYMAIKIAYIFLKTISIINQINLYAVSGFDFNENTPIKALGKKYFFRDLNDNNKVIIDFLGDNVISDFKLPNSISDIPYSTEILPEYNLPAV